MKVILPVAGKGTRLRPHTHTRAKSLVQVAGKTVLAHIVERLEACQADEYIFITDENGAQIQAYMDEAYPHLTCHYVVQEQRLGPAHAVSLAQPYIQAGDDVLIVFNDTIFVTDLTRIPKLCQEADGLIYSKEVEDYQRFGVNVVQDGYIVDMVEKPEEPISRLAQVGLYYLQDGADFMAYLQATIDAGEKVKGEYFLPSVFMRMIRDGKRFCAPELDAWLDCGKPETLLETNRYLLRERHHCEGRLHNSVLIAPVHIAPSVAIHNSIIGPNVSIGPDCVVENSIIRESIINPQTRVKEMVLDSSLLGQAVDLSGGARRMNIGDHSLLDLEG